MRGEGPRGWCLSARYLFLIRVLGDDRFPVSVKKRGKASAVSAVDEEVVDACFLVDDDDGIGHEADAFLFLDVKSVFSHIFCFRNRLNPNLPIFSEDSYFPAWSQLERKVALRYGKDIVDVHNVSTSKGW